MANEKRKIGRHHIAFYRGWLNGLSLETIADQYLEDIYDLRQAKTTLKWIQDTLCQAALRLHRYSEARILRTSLRHIINDVKQPQIDNRPTLSAFKEEFDPDDYYSERELIERYIEEYPEPKVDRTAQKRARIINKQMQAISWIESVIATDPVLDDWIAAWFNENTSKRLLMVKIYTIKDLMDTINKDGHRWWRSIPKVGAKGANKIVNWLRSYPRTLGTISPVAVTPLRQQKQLAVLQMRKPTLGIVPIEILALPSNLSGEIGRNRELAGCQLEVNSDREVIAAWIRAKAGSQHTARTYRKEAERLLLWAVNEKGRALSDLTIEDCTDYRDWLGMLGRTDDPEKWPFKIAQSAWIGPRNTPRQSENWRPFDGALSLSSVKHALVILRGFFLWLVTVRYCVFNPWDVVNTKPADDIQDDSDVELTRVLSEHQWQTVRSHFAEKGSSPSTARTEFVLEFAYATGLRLSELARSKIGHLYSKPLQNKLGQRWMLKVKGKGAKLAAVPMGESVIHALQLYLSQRGLPLSIADNDPDTPLIAQLTDNRGMSESALYKLLKDCFKEVADTLRNKGFEVDAEQVRRATTHWIRHSRGSHLAMNGTPVNVIQQLLRHASLTTTTIYTKSAEETLYTALEEIDSRTALLHKSSLRRITPNPSRGYATAAV